MKYEFINGIKKNTYTGGVCAHIRTEDAKHYYADLTIPRTVALNLWLSLPMLREGLRTGESCMPAILLKSRKNRLPSRLKIGFKERSNDDERTNGISCYCGCAGVRSRRLLRDRQLLDMAGLEVFVGSVIK